MFEYITESVGCGWCYNSDNPMEGTCTPGSFTNSDHGTCNIINTSQVKAICVKNFKNYFENSWV